MPAERRTRSRVRSTEVLKHVMTHARPAEPWSIRTLADAAGASRALIGHLVSGERDTCSTQLAERIAEVLEVPVNVLFAPVPSTDAEDNPQNEVTT